MVAARGGDAAAFGELAALHGPRMLRLARSLTGDPGAAEDAVQEALLQAWRALPSFRAESALSTWLHTIVVRTCQRQRRGQRPVASLELLREVDAAWEDPDYTVDPAEVLARASDRRELTAAILRLPEIYRVALLLHDLDGLTAAAIATATEVPLGTAKARIRRARMALVTELARDRGAATRREVPAC